jgi:hypothetical protein
MNGKQLNQAIRNALTELSTHSDELRDLDIELGDGDLGITVSLGSKAAIESLEKLSDKMGIQSSVLEEAMDITNEFLRKNKEWNSEEAINSRYTIASSIFI